MTEPELPDALFAARQVYLTERNPAETGLVKLYRDLRKDNPRQFLQELRALEADYLEACVEWRKAMGQEQTDLGTQKCLELAEKLVRELSEKHK